MLALPPLLNGLTLVLFCMDPSDSAPCDPNLPPPKDDDDPKGVVLPNVGTDDMDDDPDVSLFDEPRDVLPNPPNSDPAGVFLAPSLPPKPPHIIGAV